MRLFLLISGFKSKENLHTMNKKLTTLVTSILLLAGAVGC